MRSAPSTHLEVLDARPRREVTGEVAGCVAQPAEPPRSSSASSGPTGALAGPCLAEVEIVEGVEPRELGDRLEVVVGAQVDGDVEAFVASTLAGDEERGGLLTSAIAAGRLGGAQRGQEALGQGPAGGLLERARKPLDRLP